MRGLIYIYYLQGVRQKAPPGVRVNCVHRADPRINRRRALMPARQNIRTFIINIGEVGLVE